MRIVKETNFDFMSKTKVTRIISIFFLIVGFSSLVINKGPKLSIDFVGGTMIAVNFTEPVEIDKLKEKDINEIKTLGLIDSLKEGNKISVYWKKSKIKMEKLLYLHQKQKKLKDGIN